jgi:predicted outer membrane lipoprotein
VTFSDWLLFLHIASAFALVTALVVYWTIANAARNVDRPVDSLRYFRVAKPANVLIVVGTLGTLVFGIWLAIDFEAYQVWDGWILAAIVLWAISSSTGIRGGKNYNEAEKLAERLAAENRGDEPSTELRARLKNRNAILLNVVSSLAVLLILIDMIYKPGV